MEAPAAKSSLYRSACLPGGPVNSTPGVRAAMRKTVRVGAVSAHVHTMTSLFLNGLIVQSVVVGWTYGFCVAIAD